MTYDELVRSWQTIQCIVADHLAVIERLWWRIPAMHRRVILLCGRRTEPIMRRKMRRYARTLR